MTTPFLDKPTLVGQLVTLRPIRAEDADVIDRIIRSDGSIGGYRWGVRRKLALLQRESRSHLL